MSLLDTMAPFISSPWLDRHGRLLSVRPLPGLRPEILRELGFMSPFIVNPEYRKLLGCCSGLAASALGHIDFTGCWFPEEQCPVFHPSLTLAVDEEGRRWIAEPSAVGLPGRVWCLFTAPAVAVYVSDSLTDFLAALRERTCQGRLFSWLQDLTAQAHAVWAHRRSLALRPYHSAGADPELAAWLATLPADAYVYDLRSPMAARGWPYGLAGHNGRLFRHGRLPIFAVAAPNTDGPRLHDPETIRLPGVGPHSAGDVLPLPARQKQSVLFRPWNAERQSRKLLCA